jgi:glutamate 5-kinase
MSKGGMASKLVAAPIATATGENVIFANGREPGTLRAFSPASNSTGWSSRTARRFARGSAGSTSPSNRAATWCSITARG